MAFASEKVCAMEKIRAFGCKAGPKISTALTNYDKIADLVYAYSNTFDCNPGYLTSLLTCFSSAALEAEGIYFAQSGLSTLTNPKLIVNSEVEAIVLDSGDDVPEFGILGSSQVGTVEVKEGTVVDILTVGGTSKLAVLKSNLDSSDACVGYLRVQSCKSYKASMGVVLQGSCVKEVKVDKGAEYGGFDCAPVTGTCADAFTTLAVSDETRTAFLVTWATPANSLYAILKYRERGAEVWQEAGADNTLRPGTWIYQPDTGFHFSRMKPDTFYDIEITNVCNSGQLSAPASITAKTTV